MEEDPTLDHPELPGSVENQLAADMAPVEELHIDMLSVCLQSLLWLSYTIGNSSIMDISRYKHTQEGPGGLSLTTTGSLTDNQHREDRKESNLLVFRKQVNDR